MACTIAITWIIHGLHGNVSGLSTLHVSQGLVDSVYGPPIGVEAAVAWLICHPDQMWEVLLVAVVG